MNNNYIKVKVNGRNVNNYIKWLIKNKIDIIKLNIVNHNELELIIYNKDYKQLSKYSKTYKITIIKKYGKLGLIDIIKKNIVILSSLILAIIFLYFLSNIIFSVDIMYNDDEITSIITKELAKYNIKKYHLKKSYKYLTKVKEKILEDNNDVLEWLEIEESGTKYIIRLVERKKEHRVEEYLYQSIIAKKDATLISIRALSGEKVKSINQYVRKGEVIISGIMTKPDNTNIYTKAQGTIYGEVWYKVDLEYPLYYQEEIVTGRHKKVISFKLLNNQIPLLPYKKYKQFRTQTTYLIYNNLLPIGIIKEELYEVHIKEEIYTNEKAISKAIDEAKKKLLKNNSAIKEIKNIIILDSQNLNSKIKLSIFVSVLEDITEIIEVKEELPNKEIVEN